MKWCLKKLPTEQCIVKQCPAWQRPCGCGYLACGLPCGNSAWKGAWEDERQRRLAESGDQAASNESGGGGA